MVVLSSQASLQKQKHDLSQPPWNSPSQNTPSKRTVGALMVLISPVASKTILLSLLYTLNSLPQNFSISRVKLRPLFFPRASSVAKMSSGDRTLTHSLGCKLRTSLLPTVVLVLTFPREVSFPSLVDQKILFAKPSGPRIAACQRYLFNLYQRLRNGSATYRQTGNVASARSL